MLKIIEMQGQGSTLKLVGNVLLVLEGCVNPKVIQPIEPAQFNFALGSGTFSSEQQVGEALVINGKPYISWQENNKLVTQTQAEMQSPFLMGLDKEQKPSELLYYKPTATSTAPISLATLYEELAKQHHTGFAIVGHAKFEEFDTTYIKKPPIFGEVLIEHPADYWGQSESEKQKSVCFFGVVITNKEKKNYPNELLRKAFYQNPHESQVSSCFGHTHGSVVQGGLREPGNSQVFFSNLQNLSLTSVRHVLGHSLIQEGAFAIFPFDKILES